MGACSSLQNEDDQVKRRHENRRKKNRTRSVCQPIKSPNTSQNTSAIINLCPTNHRYSHVFNTSSRYGSDKKHRQKLSPQFHRNNTKTSKNSINSKNSKNSDIDISEIGRYHSNKYRKKYENKKKLEGRISDIEIDSSTERDHSGNKIKSTNKKCLIQPSKTLDPKLDRKSSLLHGRNSVLIVNSELIVNCNVDNPKNQYRILENIGKGGFGSVSKVMHIKTGLIRAMKRIAKPKISMPLSSIYSEIEILKKLDHPNIVKIFEFFVEADGYYLVTEYCSGGELFNALRTHKNRLSEDKIANIMYQIFDAVNYCHCNNLIHRDIKPENILIESIDEEGFYNIKIIDFGTATLYDKNKLEHRVIGSAFYIAPEVLNKNYNEKCDIWSCGVILYMLLSGKLPFVGRNENEIFSNIQKGKFNLTDHFEGVSEEAKDLIRKCLELNVNKRIKASDAKNHMWFNKFNTKERLLKVNDKTFTKVINNLLTYNPSNQLQIIALTYLVHNFPSIEEIKIINKIFTFLNKSGSGKLTKKECKYGLINYIKFANMGDLDNKIDNIFTNIDNDNNGFIECEEFCRGGLDKKIFLDKKILKFIFDYLDKDGSGEVSLDELKQVFCIRNDEESEKLLMQIIGEIDTDGNGEVSFEEFQLMMKQITVM